MPIHSLCLVVPPHAEPDRADRRAHRRRTLAELPWLREVRLKYGPRAVLIDLSGGGAQLETSGFRLNPGATVVVELAGERDESPIPSRVVRCQVTGLVPSPIYRSALEFKRKLIMPDTVAAALPADGDADPFHEHARLLLALRRLEASVAGRSAIPSQATEDSVCAAVGIDVMSAVLAMIDTPAGLRAGRRFTGELATLFSIVTRGIDEGAPEGALIDRLVERLRRTIPVREVRLTDTIAVSHGDAIYFDVALAGDQPAAKLLVEFPRHFRSEEWQFQYLKAAALVFAFVRQIGKTRAEVEETCPDGTSLAADDAGSPVSRVVVRYRDGRLLKGFTREFLCSRGVVEVWPAANGLSSPSVTVPFGQLKAIFFVRDFDGNSSHVAATSATSAPNRRGRKVTVTFLDGEELTGVTLTYQAEGVGFFVHPDDQNNNTRVFVIPQSVRHIQFL